MQLATLSSGRTMPMLGLGTWELTGRECARTVSRALRLGYRHIDTAVFYDNHKDVAAGIEDSGVDRGDIFITTKVWRDKLHFDDVLRECDHSLKELELDCVDLLLVHWPNSAIPLAETLRAFRRLLDEGKIRDAGVSNFTVKHLAQAVALDEEPIAVNQVEYHPFLNQQVLLDYCQANGVVLTAYAPLARGRVKGDTLLTSVARHCSRSEWQVALRWMVQKGIVVIPKASSDEHLKANMDIFDWTITDEDMASLDANPTRFRLMNWDVGEFED